MVIADIADNADPVFSNEASTSSPQFPFIQLDVTDYASWEALRSQLADRWSQLDLLINTAGAPLVADFGTASAADWDRVIRTNLTGTAFGCHCFAEWLRANPHGAHIVNVASYAGFLTLPWASSYNASKAGVIGLSETLRIELAPDGVGVTVACPGFFPSRLFSRNPPKTDDLSALMERMVARAELTAEDAATAILDAVRKNRLYVHIPRRTYWLWWWKRLFPESLLNRVGRQAQALRQSLRQ